MKKEACSCLRVRVIEFLIQSARHLQISPIAKYSALSLFADRFYPSLISKSKSNNFQKQITSWLLHQPLRESNLQLFTLTAIWIASKKHDSPSLHVKSLKSLADNTITEQHFTKKDFIEAELVFLNVLNFEIGMLNSVPFWFVIDLVENLKEVAVVGGLMEFETCMDIMDLVYEKTEEIVVSSSCLDSCDKSGRVILAAAAVVVAAYVITVPVQRAEFPIVPWVKFVTNCKEEDIVETVRNILMHVFEASS